MARDRQATRWKKEKGESLRFALFYSLAVDNPLTNWDIMLDIISDVYQSSLVISTGNI